MGVEEVDVVNAQPFEGFFKGIPHVLRVATGSGHRDTKLGRQEDVITLAGALEP